MISKSSITGRDGTGKTTAVDSVSQMLAKNHRVGVMTSLRSPSYLLINDQKRLLFPNLTNKIAKVYDRGQGSNNTLTILGSLFCHILLQQRFIEPKMARDYNLDFIIRDRDPIADSIVMFMVYGMRGLSIRLMMNVVEAVVGKKVRTDNLFLLTAQSKVLSERNRKNIKLDKHESPETSEKMAMLYRIVARSLMDLGRIGNLTNINTGENDQKSTAQKIYGELIKSK